MLKGITVFLVYVLVLAAATGSLAGTVQLPQTGQTGCWDAGGVSVPCLGSGQDGSKQAGVSWPTPRFTNNNNGTITDNLTGLVWLRNVNCYGGQNWTSALSIAKALANGSCGLTDGSVAGQWRLPNRKELTSLRNLGVNSEGDWLTSQGFLGSVGVGWTYWSSTSSVYANGQEAHTVFLGTGESTTNPKSAINIVWLVRD